MAHDLGRIAPRLARLVAAGTLDAPLAALAWALLEHGIPVLVAGPDGPSRGALVDALLEALPADRQPGPPSGARPADRGRVVRVAAALGPGTPAGILRAALAATTGRSGLVAAVEADDLGTVLDVVARQGLADDEVSFLGVVLVLAGDGVTGSAGRVGSAHYLRPVVRDAGGHTRRLPPAVLAAWHEQEGRWEDFSWGIMADLAQRLGTTPRALEVERDRRAALLAAGARVRGRPSVG